MADRRIFRQHILEAGILDPEGMHHEFAYGAHGRKLDFDLIQDGSDLYAEWINNIADYIGGNYSRRPDALLGVANGANRLSRDTAARIGSTALYTYKVSPREVALTPESYKQLEAINDAFVLVLEDVGTSGGTALSALRSALGSGATRAEALFTWKRLDNLSAFEEAGMPYAAIIDETLPTYTPDACRLSGYCAAGWQLISHA